MQFDEEFKLMLLARSDKVLGKILALTMVVQFLNIKLSTAFPINTTKMKKSTFLSMVLILGLSISSLAQTKEVQSQDKK